MSTVSLSVVIMSANIVAAHYPGPFAVNLSSVDQFAVNLSSVYLSAFNPSAFMKL